MRVRPLVTRILLPGRWRAAPPNANC